MDDKDCIFCKISRKEIPASIIFENEHVLSFLDIMPANKGHCLVIPKRHYSLFHDISEKDLCEMMAASQKIAKAISLSMGNEAYNLLMNNGKAAGQIVSHAHIHIVPRFEHDSIDLSWKHNRYKPEEIEESKLKIKKFL